MICIAGWVMFDTIRSILCISATRVYKCKDKTKVIGKTRLADLTFLSTNERPVLAGNGLPSMKSQTAASPVSRTQRSKLAPRV